MLQLDCASPKADERLGSTPLDLPGDALDLFDMAGIPFDGRANLHNVCGVSGTMSVQKANEVIAKVAGARRAGKKKKAADPPMITFICEFRLN